MEIKYTDVAPEPRVPVRKQIWDGQEFVPVTMYRITGRLTKDQKDWLYDVSGATPILIALAFVVLIYAIIGWALYRPSKPPLDSAPSQPTPRER